MNHNNTPNQLTRNQKARLYGGVVMTGLLGAGLVGVASTLDQRPTYDTPKTTDAPATTATDPLVVDLDTGNGYNPKTDRSPGYGGKHGSSTEQATSTSSTTSEVTPTGTDNLHPVITVKLGSEAPYDPSSDRSPGVGPGSHLPNQPANPGVSASPDSIGKI